MPRLLDPTIHFAVERDGLPRVGLYDDGAQHVLYLDGDTVRSLTDTEWLATHGPLPTDPTQAQIDAALAAREAARQQVLADAAALRQQIITLAQSAVGVRVDNLTGAQVRALFALTVLRPAGAIDAAFVVRALGEWVRG